MPQEAADIHTLLSPPSLAASPGIQQARGPPMTVMEPDLSNLQQLASAI